MKRALLVGIDDYENFSPLSGCANDAAALQPLLTKNEDDSPNLDCRLASVRDGSSRLSRDKLLQMVDELLAGGATYALLYFAGHGSRTNGGVALATSDATENTPGVMFSEILARINTSSVSEITVILDCCFSGGATTIEALNNGLANLRTGLGVLTASRNDEASMETAEGRGQFSTYLEGALDGGAADVLGHVTVAGLYAYLSESFGAWEQRPTFKANIDRLENIRRCKPRVPLPILRKLTEWFPAPDYEYPLDPSYEPTADADVSPNEEIFSGLQKYRACQLVVPIDEEHMYYAAMHSTGCRLTALGKHYWGLVDAGRI
ncbi:peptidase C14 [Mycobacterium sp. 852002-51971_SCH5477799-a]|uniref:caspase family protein n=1 Tax=Mycobacterium sp. 852002-51971_SCH5477799-a TaxID=1834106 RepID=UPI0007FDF524|nr:caspase family protein [Mycobacterium sp. 852002-51971_SCH5477799-a]OBF63041.1 peptidase C14 [Mycobacterium sp. 852002-51971_SCH5477799-a]